MTDHENKTNCTPGEPVSTKSKALFTGAHMVQDLSPVKNICAHLNGHHAYASDTSRCVEANHYCSIVNEDFRQCVLYDTPDANARLIGVEYMISAKLFKTLPDEEKKLWHTHIYEVKSGLVCMPAPNTIPQALWEKAESAEMKQIMGFYGKTYHFWQIDRGDPLPLGPPQLMIALTNDGQADLDKLLAGRNERFNVDHHHKRKIRESIPVPDIDTKNCADGVWEKGNADI